ncbi:MAG: glycosyltransferase family 1 protein [Ilumatobacteraceae bacterium]
MAVPLRIAYTLEQLWHEVPGGTAVSALRVARELTARDDVELVGVAGRHARPPAPAYRPDIPVRALPVARPWLYQTWLRFGWPLVEAATGPVDVCHATGLVPAVSRAPLVVTVHDLAFRRSPERFSRHGARTMRRSLDVIRRRADLVLCSSTPTVDDLLAADFPDDRLRLVPLGVDVVDVTDADIDRVRREHTLPEHFVLFVGTMEPRKNLVRLAEAVARLDDTVPLVVVGVDGWGGVEERVTRLDLDVRFLGFVPDADLAACYAAATVFAYPSEWEGFGLPVAEAMAQGTPVVTSRATSMAELVGGAAVLVDPVDVDDIARGLTEALDPAGRDERAAAGRDRVASMTWAATAEATVAAYREVAA